MARATGRAAMTQLRLFRSADTLVYDPSRREGQADRHGSIPVNGSRAARCDLATLDAPLTPAVVAPPRDMLPADRTKLNELADRRLRRDFGTAVRQAALNATASELRDLDRLVTLLDTEHIDLDDARARLEDLRRDQERRRVQPLRRAA